VGDIYAYIWKVFGPKTGLAQIKGFV